MKTDINCVGGSGSEIFIVRKKESYCKCLIQIMLLLRTVPTFATAHTFFASCGCPRKSSFLMVVSAKTETFLHGS